MNKNLKHCQVGFFFVVNNTPAVEGVDVPDLLFKVEDKVAEAAFKASKNEPFWTKNVVDHDVTYQNTPYEVCETGYEGCEIDGKFAQSIWIHSEAEIPKEDEAAMTSLVKRCIAEVAESSGVIINFIGIKHYAVYEVSEMSELVPA